MARRTGAVALAAVLFVLATATVASAGSYNVYSCEGAPDGQANNAWVAVDADPTHVMTSADCTQGRLTGGPSPDLTGLSSADVMGRSDFVPLGDTAYWQFRAPANATISGVSLLIDLYKLFDSNWHTFVRGNSSGAFPGQDCTFDPATAYQCEIAENFTQSGLSDTTFAVGIVCSDLTNTTCEGGATSHNVRADLDSATVTLRDSTPPSTPTFSGPLTTAGTHAGVQELDVASNDSVGIASVQVKASDGTLVGSASPTCDYTYAVPCPSGMTAVQVDTTKLPDGTDPVTVTVTDAAQNTSSASVDVQVSNHAPYTPILSGVPNGWTNNSSLEIGAVTPSGGPVVTDLFWSLCYPGCDAPTDVPVGGAGQVSFPITLPQDGSYRLIAWTEDSQGHTSPIAQGAVELATAPPGAPERLHAGRAADGTIGATWTDPAGDRAPLTTTYWQLCTVDGAICGATTTIPDSRTLTTSSAAASSYLLKVWLADAAGNLGPAAAATIAAPASPSAAAGAGMSDATGNGGGAGSSDRGLALPSLTPQALPSSLPSLQTRAPGTSARTPPKHAPRHRARRSARLHARRASPVGSPRRLSLSRCLACSRLQPRAGGSTHCAKIASCAARRHRSR